MRVTRLKKGANMFGEWKTVLNKEVEGRNVEIQIYSDNKSYKIITTQLKDVEPVCDVSDDNTTMYPSYDVGDTVEDDYDVTLENMIESLVALDFSRDSANEIFNEINR